MNNSFLDFSPIPQYIIKKPRYGVLTDAQLWTISFIFLVTSLLSLFGTGSIIYVAIKKRKVCSSGVLPLFHLCLADFLGGFILIIGTSEHFTHSVRNRTFCLVLTMLATSFYMTTFVLTVNYAWKVYRQVKIRADPIPLLETSSSVANVSHPWYRISTPALVYFLCWFVPFAFSMFVMFSDSEYDENKKFILNDDICSCCFPLFVYESSSCQRIRNVDHRFNWYSHYKFVFLFLLLISSTLITILYGLIFVRFKGLLLTGGVIGPSQYELLYSARRRAGLFAAVFVFSWLSTLILGSISFKKKFSMTEYYPLFVIQACTSPLQGFLNSMIYGWQRKTFRVALNEETPLLDPASAAPDFTSDANVN